jgi:hypothetical protein
MKFAAMIALHGKHVRRGVVALLFVSWTPTLQAADEITFYDRATKAIATVQATIDQETPQGIRFRIRERDLPTDLPAEEIIDIGYEVPGSLRLLYTRVRNDEKRIALPGNNRTERLQALGAASKGYEELLKLSQGMRLTQANRHWQFRLARLHAQAAFEEPQGIRSAVRELEAIFSPQPEGWQAGAALRLAARLLIDSGDYGAAAEIYRRAQGWSALSVPAKREAGREAIRIELLGKRLSEAKKNLDTLAAQTPVSGPELIRLKGIEALRDVAAGRGDSGFAALDALKTQTKDPGAQAFICLLQGYGQNLTGQPDKALWAFLRIDQLLPEDRVTEAQAVDQLVRLFEARGDWNKAAQFRQKLWRDFAG